MPGIPTLEQRQSRGTVSDLSDHNPVRLQSQRHFQALQLVEFSCRQHAQAVCVRAGAKIDHVTPR
jgi:hypothetical protein